MVEKRIEQRLDELYREFRDEMEFYQKESVLAKTRGVNDEDLYAFGEQLANEKSWIEFTESTGSSSDLGVLPQISLDVITASMAQSVMPLFASVQPINEKKGLVYFRTVDARTTRGNVTAGDTLSTSTNYRTKIEQGFASERVEAFDTGAAGDGSTQDFAVTVPYTPIRPRTVEVYLADNSARAIDDGNGNLLGIGCSGTINYETGDITIHFDTAPASGVAILANYDTNFERLDEIPTIGDIYDSKTVIARAYALRSEVGLFKSFELQKRFGMNAEELIARDLTTELNTEILNNGVRVAYANAIGAETFDYTPPAGISLIEHKLTFFDTLAKAESNILANAGRSAAGYTMIAGTKAAAFLRTLPGFELNSNLNASLGTHLFGTLDGKPVIRSMSMPDNEIVLVGRGNSMFDASLVYAPYLPITVTQMMVGQDHNPLKSQKGIATIAAIDSIVPQLSTKIVILHL